MMTDVKTLLLPVQKQPYVYQPDQAPNVELHEN